MKNRKEKNMSLMNEWDDSLSSTSSNNINGGDGSNGGQQIPYKFLKAKENIVKQEERSLGHPMSKFTIGLMLTLAISLPVISFILAGRALPGGLSIPFYIFGLPSWILLVPILMYYYRIKGNKPYIKSRGIIGLMSISFSFYSLYQILYSMYLIRPFFNSDIKEYNSSYSWIILIPLVYFHLTVYIQHLLLAQCKMRKPLYLYLISYPSSLFFTTVLISIPFHLIAPFIPAVFGSLIMIIPFLLGLLGLYQTLITRKPNKWQVKDIYLKTTKSELDEEENSNLINNSTSSSSTTIKRKMKRVKIEPLKNHNESIVDFKQPLSIIQIADPHLGPIMSVDRLTEICESTVKLNPDLVLLTGDFFTAESLNPENALKIALQPLKKLPPGKLFACLGNHDYEEGCLEILEDALKSIDCVLLVDQSVLVETRIGKVQILGFDYRSKARQEHILGVCNAYPPIDGVPRITMLHDPGAFKFIPLNDTSITFSGHTHGGQIGIPNVITMVGATGMPDSGLWKNGNNYLYVHTGQGCRSMLGTMVLRCGVIAEDSLLQIYFES